MTNSDPVRVSRQGPRTTITIDAPQTRNALTPAMLNTLIDGIREVSRDELVRAVVITGTQTTFSSGTDMRAEGTLEERATGYARLYELIESIDQPVIARVNGHVYGGAIGIVASCDLAVMSEAGTLGFPESRMGMVATTAAVPCVRRVGVTNAAELLLTGRRFSASHAAQIGLVNRSVPLEQLDEIVDGYLEDICSGGPRAIAASKKLIKHVRDVSYGDALRWSVALTEEIAGTAEAAEGRAARLENRRPNWVSS